MKSNHHLKYFIPLTLYPLALGVLLFIGWSAWETLSRPDIGFRWSSTGVIRYVGSKSPAAGQLQTGDRILTIDGEPLSKSNFLVEKGQPGDLVHLEVERNEKRLSFELPYAARAPLILLFLNLALIVIALVFWFVGMVVLAFSQSKYQGILFFVNSLILSGLLASSNLVGYVWTIRLSILLTWWVGPIMVHFHLIFPTPALTGTVRRFIIVFAYTIAFLGGFPYIISPIISIPNLPPDWLFVYTLVYDLQLLISLLVVVFLLVRTYRVTSSPMVRRQVGLVTLSGIIALTPVLVFSLLPEILVGYPILPPEVTLLFFSAIPLGYGYAIFRFQFIRLERHISRSMTLFLVITLLCGLYITTNTALTSLISADQRQLPIINLAIVMVPVVAFSPLHRRIRILVDKLFYGGWYDYPSVVGAVTGKLSKTVDTSTLAEALSQIIQKAMRVKWASLLLPDRETELTAMGVAGEAEAVAWLEAISLAADSPLMQHLHSQSGPTTSREICAVLSGPHSHSNEARLLTNQSLRLLIPIRGRYDSTGVLLLGPKYGGDLFDANDLEILSVVAHQASMAFQNAQLIAELEARARESSQYQQRALHAREEERKHVARELHDDIIQSLVGIKYHVYGLQDSVAGEVNGEIAQLKEQLGHLIGQTRRICRGLRPPALDLGLVPALRSLIHDTRSSSQLDMRLTVGGDQDQPLDEDMALSLFRFTQEALANVQKHADARQVHVTLELGSDEVSLVVKDDGCGFVVPERLGDLMKNNHFGLVGLRERLELVNGTLQITSAQGLGTRLEARVRRKPPTFRSPTEEVKDPDLGVGLAPLYHKSPSPIRVLIADDHAVVRGGVRHEIAQQLDMEVIAEAVDGRSTLRLVQTHQPTVLILDIHFPDISGIEVMNQLAHIKPAVPLPHVLVLSAYNDFEYVTSMMAAGAKGYLLKDSEPAQIVRSVRQVVRGELALSVAVLDQLYSHPLPLSVPLMARERSVLQLMARGYTNSQIAESLGIAIDENEVTKIYKKLAVQTRAEAVSWAWQSRIVSLE